MCVSITVHSARHFLPTLACVGAQALGRGVEGLALQIKEISGHRSARCALEYAQRHAAQSRRLWVVDSLFSAGRRDPRIRPAPEPIAIARMDALLESTDTADDADLGSHLLHAISADAVAAEDTEDDRLREEARHLAPDDPSLPAGDLVGAEPANDHPLPVCEFFCGKNCRTSCSREKRSKPCSKTAFCNKHDGHRAACNRERTPASQPTLQFFFQS